MHDFWSHSHQITIPLTVVPLVSWVAGLQGFFTATMAMLATAWYIYLFWQAWKARKK